MAAPSSQIVTTPGFGTAGDLLAPMFQVYVGTGLDRIDQRDPAILVDKDAVAEVRRAIDDRIAAEKLIPLAGPWADHKGQTNDVLSVVFEESIESNFPLATLRVTLHNVYDDAAQTYRYTDLRGDRPPIIEYGRALVLRMGYPMGGKLDDVEPVFEGIITTIEPGFPGDGEPTVEVTASDRRDRMRGSRKKRGRHFKAGTAAEQIIADVAADYGLRVAVTAAQDEAIRGKRSRTKKKKADHQTGDQDAITFIADVAKRHALELSAFGDVIFVQDPGDVTTEALRYAYRAGLIAFTPRFNAVGRPVKVTVISRDSETGKPIEATADTGVLKQLGLTPPGNSAVDRIVGEQGGDDDARTLVVTNYALQDADEAMQLAVGLLKRNLDQTFTASGELVGDPRVRVRSTLDVGGTGRWDGAYYVTMSRHRFGGNGYQTSFNARRNRALLEPGEEVKAGP